MHWKKKEKSSENSWKIGVYQSVFDYFFIWLLEADFTAKYLSTIILPPIKPDHVKNVQIVRSITFNVLFKKPQKYFRNMTLSKATCDLPTQLCDFYKNFFSSNEHISNTVNWL